ncbi:MAG: MinD/ParA family protein [Desulfohalobiaceae bacterium]
MSQKNTLSISILSGKGGVGKTNIALNLAYALYNMHESCMLMDCDMGLANLDVLLGVAPERNLEDLLEPDTAPEDVLFSLEPNGFDFLPAASGVPELVEWDWDLQTILFQKLNKHFSSYNYLILDLGAGISTTVTSLAAMTRVKCVVISPEPTSLTDGYALIKVLHSQKQVQRVFIIVNMVKSRQEGEQSFKRLQAACEKFLGIQVQLLGIILYDQAVAQAILKQIPLSKHASRSEAYKGIQRLAEQIQLLRDKLQPELNKPIELELEGG